MPGITTAREPDQVTAPGVSGLLPSMLAAVPEPFTIEVIWAGRE